MNNRYSHAVSRSAEFLSCAKTVVKIAKSRRQQQQQQNREDLSLGYDWSENLHPSSLKLHDPIKRVVASPLNNVLEDVVSLLHAMELELKKLDGLVRRRGHSNDPTHEISVAVAAIEHNAAQLSAILQTLEQRGSSGLRNHQQRQRHIKAIQEWFQTMAQQYAARLKNVLTVRATVLAEQAQRRGMFQATNKEKLIDLASVPSLTLDNNSSHVDVVSSEAEKALFAHVPPRLNAVRADDPRIFNSDQHDPSLPGKIPSYAHASASSDQHGCINKQYESTRDCYGGGYGFETYQQTFSVDKISSSSKHAEGVRRRKQPAVTIQSRKMLEKDDGIEMEDPALQQQVAALEQRQRYRQTASRLKEARQAEQSLAALGTVFGKMSTLISQQSETLSKIEDDVEAAHFDVNAGHEEISTLYMIKKGNRMLIVKVFCLLNFLIVFMRFYVRK